MPRPRSVTDDQIIRAAVAAIGSHGPVRLTLAHVAEQAGISPAALIQRFGSKAALLTAVAEAGTGHAETIFDEAAAGGDPPLDALREALVAFAGDIGDRSQFANHMAMLHLDLADPELRRRAADQAAVVRRSIAGLLARAVAEGQLGRHTTGRLADVVYTAYNGALITWAIDGTGPLDEWIRSHIDAVIDPYQAR